MKKKPTYKQEQKKAKKIIKICNTPENFCFEYINGASVQSDIRRMKEYVACVRKVEKSSLKGE